jgi:hypothetical protein
MIRYLLLLLFIGAGWAPAQEVAPQVTLEKQPLLILPAKGGDDPESIDARVTAIVAAQATALKRFEVVDRTHLKALLEEQALQLSGLIDAAEIVELGQLAAAPEALLVTVINFGQKGVPPEEEKEEEKKDRKVARKAGLLGVLLKEVTDAAVDKATKDVERYPNNIQTVLQAEVRKIDVATGKSLDSFTIQASHTGGNKQASLAHTLRQVELQVSRQLRELYLLTSQVLEVRGNEVLLLLGQEMGVRRGTLFEISSPPTKRVIQDREILLPGRSVGLVRVTELSRDANRGRVLRRWDRIEPGYQAVESTRGIVGINPLLGYGSDAAAFLLQFRLGLAPLDRFGMQAQFQVGTIRDSRDDTDFLFGFGLNLQYRLIRTSPFTLAGTVALPLDLVSRSDDRSHTVVAPVFAPRIGTHVTLLLAPHRDLVFAVEYAFASTAGEWKYSKENDAGETDTFPAVWRQAPAPEIDARGLYFSVGVRFLTF